jgi:DnaJ-related protein SCJ1
MKNFYLLIILLGFTFAKDLYKILEVDRSASQVEIKKKYRELTRKYHPDKNQGNAEASAKFADVAEAHEILIDPKKRRQYDRGGMDAVKDGGEAQQFDPFDIFGNMFGGGRRENRDRDLKIKLRVTLKDIYLGREHEVSSLYNRLSSNIQETLYALTVEEVVLIPTMM